jgi:peptidoglycan hydrolase-like protein with peptidoglycan-binding domain
MGVLYCDIWYGQCWTSARHKTDEFRKELQSALDNLRFRAGTADEIIEQRTILAFRRFHTSQGFEAVGYQDRETIEALRSAAKLFGANILFAERSS